MCPAVLRIPDDNLRASNWKHLKQSSSVNGPILMSPTASLILSSVWRAAGVTRDYHGAAWADPAAFPLGYAREAGGWCNSCVIVQGRFWNVRETRPCPSVTKISPADVAAQARDFTVLVECWK